MSPNIFKQLPSGLIALLHVRRAIDRQGVEPSEHVVSIALEHDVSIIPGHGHEVVQSQRPDLIHHGLTLSGWRMVLDHGHWNVLFSERVRRYRCRVFHVETLTMNRRSHVNVRPTELANDVNTIIRHLALQSGLKCDLLDVFFRLGLVAIETGTNTFDDFSTLKCLAIQPDWDFPNTRSTTLLWCNVCTIRHVLRVAQNHFCMFNGPLLRILSQLDGCVHNGFQNFYMTSHAGHFAVDVRPAFSRPLTPVLFGRVEYRRSSLQFGHPA